MVMTPNESSTKPALTPGNLFIEFLATDPSNAAEGNGRLFDLSHELVRIATVFHNDPESTEAANDLTEARQAIKATPAKRLRSTQIDCDLLALDNAAALMDRRQTPRATNVQAFLHRRLTTAADSAQRYAQHLSPEAKDARRTLNSLAGQMAMKSLISRPLQLTDPGAPRGFFMLGLPHQSRSTVHNQNFNGLYMYFNPRTEQSVTRKLHIGKRCLRAINPRYEAPDIETYDPDITLISNHCDAAFVNGHAAIHPYIGLNNLVGSLKAELDGKAASATVARLDELHVRTVATILQDESRRGRYGAGE